MSSSNLNVTPQACLPGIQFGAPLSFCRAVTRHSCGPSRRVCPLISYAFPSLSIFHSGVWYCCPYPSKQLAITPVSILSAATINQPNKRRDTCTFIRLRRLLHAAKFALKLPYLQVDKWYPGLLLDPGLHIALTKPSSIVYVYPSSLSRTSIRRLPPLSSTPIHRLSSALALSSTLLPAPIRLLLSLSTTSIRRALSTFMHRRCLLHQSFMG